jgi:site-specific recombinase XerD
MNTTNQQQTTIDKTVAEFLGVWLEAFLIDRRSQNLSPKTLKYYRINLETFSRYCETQAVSTLEQVSPDVLRRFLIWLEETGHNAGGAHGHYRAVRAFLIWYEQENEPENWRNPIRKVKPPKVGKEILEPVSLETVSALLENCGADFYGMRDKALLLFLLDTGARASEVSAMNVKDVNVVTGEALIQHGKGDKARKVYLGVKSRKAIRSYLRIRTDGGAALFVGKTRERLTYDGIRQVIERRVKSAKVGPVTCHSFRRAFAINCLRAGMNIYTLKELMGHEDLQVLQRYLKVTEADAESAHRLYAPVDNLLKRKEQE